VLSSVFFFVFFGRTGLNSELYAYKAGTLPLECYLQSLAGSLKVLFWSKN
jgi:hypothetical protein